MELHKTPFVIQSVSDESQISSIKKEISAVAPLLRNGVQMFCAIKEFRKDTSFTLRMAQAWDVDSIKKISTARK